MIRRRIKIKKYEYMHRVIYKSLELWLNEHGDEGWELINARSVGNGTECTLKRLKLGNDTKQLLVE